MKPPTNGRKNRKTAGEIPTNEQMAALHERWTNGERMRKIAKPPDLTKPPSTNGRRNRETPTNKRTAARAVGSRRLSHDLSLLVPSSSPASPAGLWVSFVSAAAVWVAVQICGSRLAQQQRCAGIGLAATVGLVLGIWNARRCGIGSDLWVWFVSVPLYIFFSKK